MMFAAGNTKQNKRVTDSSYKCQRVSLLMSMKVDNLAITGEEKPPNQWHMFTLARYGQCSTHQRDFDQSDFFLSQRNKIKNDLDDLKPRNARVM